MISTKNIFWEALVLTIAIFFIGIYLGIAYESKKINDINNYYSGSEIFLVDSLAISEFSKTNQTDCENFIKSNIVFADRIYNEATLLEKYGEAEKITDSMKMLHKRYDLLRTILWINIINMPEICKKNISRVVYLYNYETKNLVEKAEQQVWSRVLFDLKQEKGNNIILIPIAVDSNLTSLNMLINRFNVKEFPAVIINEKYLIYDLKSTEKINSYLELKD